LGTFRKVEQMVAYSPGPEWIVVAVVLILLFGAKKLPELARSVGKSTSEFKKGMSEGSAESAEAPAPSASEEAGTSEDAEQKAERKAETAE
jgi:sec-independent protein translocase protein TatA